VIQSEFRRWNE